MALLFSNNTQEFLHRIKRELYIRNKERRQKEETLQFKEMDKLQNIQETRTKKPGIVDAWITGKISHTEWVLDNVLKHIKRLNNDISKKDSKILLLEKNTKAFSKETNKIPKKTKALIDKSEFDEKFLTTINEILIDWHNFTIEERKAWEELSSDQQAEFIYEYVSLKQEAEKEHYVSSGYITITPAYLDGTRKLLLERFASNNTDKKNDNSWNWWFYNNDQLNNDIDWAMFSDVEQEAWKKLSKNKKTEFRNKYIAQKNKMMRQHILRPYKPERDLKKLRRTLFEEQE